MPVLYYTLNRYKSKNGSLRNCPAEREASHSGRKSVAGLLGCWVGGLLGWFVNKLTHQPTNALKNTLKGSLAWFVLIWVTKYINECEQLGKAMVRFQMRLFEVLSGSLYMMAHWGFPAEREASHCVVVDVFFAQRPICTSIGIRNSARSNILLGSR